MPTASSRKTKRPSYVLIIEDNVHHAELVTEILDRHFSPVIIHTVDSFEDGIKFASQSSYDLILTDGVIKDLPVTDSFSKLADVSEETPIIVISGRGDESLAAELTKRGASEYLSKTRETLENLSALLAKYMGRTRTKRRLKTPNAKIIPEAPTPSEIIREVDRLTQQALAIAGPKHRKRTQSMDDIEQLDQLPNQIRN